MKTTELLGRNKSGVTRDPGLTRAMLAGMEEFPPSSEGDAEPIAGERVAYAEQGEPIATMPPPAGVAETVGKTIKTIAKGALQKMLQGRPDLYLDKLGARLAFERSGVRLYDALISKLDAYGAFAGGPSREDLEHIRDEELQHFTMLSEAMEKAGGDPTAVTPSANVEATASKGIEAVLADPRCDLLQSLEVILIAELADNDCWQALTDLAEGAGESERAARFADALQEEREHLAKVRTWVAAGQGREPELLGGAEPPPQTRATGGGRRVASASPRASAKGKARGRSAAAKRSNGARRTSAQGGKGAAKSAAKTTGRSRGNARGGKRAKKAAGRR